MFLYKVTNNVKFVDLEEECPSTSGVTLQLRDANATRATLNFAPTGLYDSGSCLGLSSHFSNPRRFLCIKSKRSSIKTNFSRREVQNYSVITEGM